MTEEKLPLYARIMTGYIQRRPIEMLIDTLIKQIDNQSEGTVSVACFDIDGFGKIEADHGYQIADALLEKVSLMIDDVVGSEFATRYVRDSFIVVYDGLTLEEAFFEAEQLRRQMSQTEFELSDDDKTISVTVAFSAGVGSYPGEPESRYELLNMAEEASRQAYKNGGNSILFARPTNMVPKTSHYTPEQLDRLRDLRKQLGRSEASLLREALDDFLRKYDQRDMRRTLLVTPNL